MSSQQHFGSGQSVIKCSFVHNCNYGVDLCGGGPSTDTIARLHGHRRVPGLLTEENRATIEEVIEARAQDNGLTIDHATLTDGNCGPDSILRNLERLQPTDTNSSKILRVAARDRHRALAAMRLMMCIWIRDNASVELLPGTTVEQYVQMEDCDSIGTYVNGMKTPGKWIDTLMLFAASAVFKVQFVCLMPEPCAPSLVGQQSLLVCAIAKCNLHFWALEPKCHQRELWNLEFCRTSWTQRPPIFYRCAMCSTASCDDAEEEEPEVTKQVVVAHATDFAALFKSWDAFLGNQDLFAIMESTEPLESQTHLS